MLLFNFSWYRKQIKNLCILFLNVSLCFCFLILFQTLQTGSEIILGGGGSGVWKCQVDWHIKVIHAFAYFSPLFMNKGFEFITFNSHNVSPYLA